MSTDEPVTPAPPVPRASAPPPLPPAAAPAPEPTPGPAAAQTLSTTCPTCGSTTAYAPGTTSLSCPSCGAHVEIAATEATIREHSYDEWRAKHGDIMVASIGARVVACRNCGASTETVDLAGRCQFCGGALVAVDHPEGVVPPEAVLPFHVDQPQAQAAFGQWAGSRWFAPSGLKKINSAEGLSGTYVPHWTFDAHTETDYRGQRGEHYYVTRTRSVSDGKGGTRTETYQERRTRWYDASGHVRRDFDDLLVVGSTRLDPERLAQMGPWTLADARPFQQEYLTGFSALRYDVDPQEGAKQARGQMRVVIEDDCEDDIGGDEQRVSDMDVTYSAAMFKLILVPLWIASYLYGGKSFQVMVNANTGEVIGDRPYSAVKITLAVIAGLVLVGVIVAAILAGRSTA